MSNKIIILTVIYFSSLIPQGISLPQGCPCGRRQSDNTGFTQYVLARPWSEYRVDNPSSYISFPLAISRGTRAIKSRLESSEEVQKSDDKLLRRNPINLDDRVDIKPKVVIPSRPRIKTKNDKINTGSGDKKSSAVIEEKKVREGEDIDDEDNDDDDDDDDDDDEEAIVDEDQKRINGLNLLGQLFRIMAWQYQNVFGKGNNLTALETNSTAVEFDGDEDQDDDDGSFELDYDYDLEPKGQIERPEIEDDGESGKKEKRKTEEKKNKDKVINKNLLRRKVNVTSTTKPSSD
ncbi:zinc finger protein 652-B-like [Microplitis mediator]|uniref:zinc finger protein 652-B-like n=1 Tax=Microplitis mediator TaxID=375433 RepID=UPI0025548D32|nr:zinc finger protein 652-B-like [Microplitis mediator]